MPFKNEGEVVVVYPKKVLQECEENGVELMTVKPRDLSTNSVLIEVFSTLYVYVTGEERLDSILVVAHTLL